MSSKKHRPGRVGAVSQYTQKRGLNGQQQLTPPEQHVKGKIKKPGAVRWRRGNPAWRRRGQEPDRPS